ncbi:ARL13B [Lepeophtheirus salmonis]|uniref:ARL13B n=1 Tax=Lepeophtheirus salmonis TaxID=72036 RepID=A0A7R8CPH9_LEPSM|nr:ARL13B [Lepeophtheirus salmonis]CAF2886585.1 ARL13B [Lepeophtheirus salmonis]
MAHKIWRKKLLRSPCCCSCLKGSESNIEIFILMLGLDNAGKTCTAKNLVGEPLINITPTVGFSKVQTEYKGYNITIYDLGGSKSFRGIWPKYFHEVHGYIFVVDSSDEVRLKECSLELQSFLRHEKVRGKPLLLLCNKSDEEHAVDELHLVEALNIEKLVNEAACPTRVESTDATKGKGLRDGYKWLTKSIISDIRELGQRVEKDKDFEREKDAIRLENIRKRIKERKEREAKEEKNIIRTESPPMGFVPISDLAKKLTNGNSSSNGGTKVHQTPPSSSKKRRKSLKQIFNNKTAPLPSLHNGSTVIASRF